MQRLTFVADDALAERIRRTARLRRKSISEIIREKVEQGFEADQGERRFPFIGLFESDGTWQAEDLDDFLKETWSDAIMRHRAD
ncbi:MAG: ribbon-helix-helix protein, CopG family [Tepidiformaceae bacterium]